ncbi:hypothetical protein C0995_011171 [Termitomyces sp. Mi166|nr:hypothetical protein C0995_011171 [Termitomyces sp. Mi166\
MASSITSTAVDNSANSLRHLEISPPSISLESPPNNLNDSQQAGPILNFKFEKLFALIIGIDNYGDATIPPLSGAVNDANDVEKFLIKLHVPNDRIVKLLDKDATKGEIIQRMENLAADNKIDEQDPILIYYAGHGGEVKAPSGWSSNSGMIQMILPYDFRREGSQEGTEGQAILDREFSQFLAKIARKKSNNILEAPILNTIQTVIFDCCHSASGTRNPGDNALVRRFKLPEEYTISQHLISSLSRLERSDLNSHVLLAACKHDQLAIESKGNGHFTRALLNVLEDQDITKLTYTTLITSLPVLSSEQHPQCEGVHQNRILFTSKPGGAQPAAYRIDSKVGRPNEYTLAAGRAHGIANGATLTVYSDKDLKSVIGSVVARDTDLFFTQCSVDGGQFALVEPAYAAQTHRAKEQYLRLFIDTTDLSYDRLVKLIKGDRPADISTRPIYIMSDNGDNADLAISTTHDGLVQFEVKNRICREHGLTHMPFNEVKVDESEYLLSILHSAADFYWHLDLRQLHRGTSLAKIVNLECRKLASAGFTDDLEGEMLEPDGRNLNNEGIINIDIGEEPEPYGYMIKNLSKRPLYAALVYFDISDLSIGN